MKDIVQIFCVHNETACVQTTQLNSTTCSTYVWYVKCLSFDLPTANIFSLCYVRIYFQIIIKQCVILVIILTTKLLGISLGSS